MTIHPLSYCVLVIFLLPFVQCVVQQYGVERKGTWSHVSLNRNDTFVATRLTWRGVGRETYIRISVDPTDICTIIVNRDHFSIISNPSHSIVYWKQDTQHPIAELGNLVRFRIGIDLFANTTPIPLDFNRLNPLRISLTIGGTNVTELHSIDDFQSVIRSTQDSYFHTWTEWFDTIQSNTDFLQNLHDNKTFYSTYMPPYVSFFVMERIELFSPETLLASILFMIWLGLVLLFFSQRYPLKTRFFVPFAYVIFQLVYLSSATIIPMIASFNLLEYNCIFVWLFQYSSILVCLVLTLLQFTRHVIQTNLQILKWRVASKMMDQKMHVPRYFILLKALGRSYVLFFVAMQLYFLFMICFIVVFTVGGFQCTTQTIFNGRVIYNSIIILCGIIAILLLLIDIYVFRRNTRDFNCSRFLISDNNYYRVEVYIFFFTLFVLFGATSIIGFTIGFGCVLGSALRNTILCYFLLLAPTVPILVNTINYMSCHHTFKRFASRKSRHRWCCGYDQEIAHEYEIVQLVATREDVMKNPYIFVHDTFIMDMKFDDFCIRESVIEYLSCYRDVQKYKQTDSNRKYLFAVSIVETYMDGGPLDVDVPKEKFVDQISCRDYRDDLFLDLEQHAHSLLLDTFKRYSTTDDFYQFVVARQRTLRSQRENVDQLHQSIPLDITETEMLDSIE
jgi:hypothetical protein